LLHANRKTRAIFPSQARVAAALGCSVKAVERGTAQLVADGWLERRRTSPRGSYAYAFIDAKRDEVEATYDQSDPTDLSGHEHSPDAPSDPTEVSGADPTEPSPRDPTKVSEKHPKDNTSSG